MISSSDNSSRDAFRKALSTMMMNLAAEEAVRAGPTTYVVFRPTAEFDPHTVTTDLVDCERVQVQFGTAREPARIAHFFESVLEAWAYVAEYVRDKPDIPVWYRGRDAYGRLDHYEYPLAWRVLTPSYVEDAEAGEERPTGEEYRSLFVGATWIDESALPLVAQAPHATFWPHDAIAGYPITHDLDGAGTYSVRIGRSDAPCVEIARFEHAADAVRCLEAIRAARPDMVLFYDGNEVFCSLAGPVWSSLATALAESDDRWELVASVLDGETSPEDPEVVALADSDADCAAALASLAPPQHVTIVP